MWGGTEMVFAGYTFDGSSPSKSSPPILKMYCRRIEYHREALMAIMPRLGLRAEAQNVRCVGSKRAIQLSTYACPKCNAGQVVQGVSDTLSRQSR